MGVDAGIFAKKAEKYFWFDRLYNIERYWLLKDDELFSKLDKVKYVLMEKDNQLSVDQIIDFLECNLRALPVATEEDRSNAGWVEQIIEFVKAHPNDSFFVSTDHDDAYDLIGEMHGKRDIWHGKYKEWKP